MEHPYYLSAMSYSTIFDKDTLFTIIEMNHETHGHNWYREFCVVVLRIDKSARNSGKRPEVIEPRNTPFSSGSCGGAGGEFGFYRNSLPANHSPMVNTPG